MRRFHALRASTVKRDVVRAARLNVAAPRPRAVAPPGRTRVARLVVSMTSIPARAKWLQPALRSVVDQQEPPDRVVLAWPWRSRTGEPYPPPPRVPAGVEVLRCDDCGPATKLLPVLRAEPDAVIVAVDDDVVYPLDFLGCLMAGHSRHPEAAVGLRGWRIPADLAWPEHVFATGIRSSAQVDVLMGTWGYLVPPGALDAAVHDFTGWPPEVRWADDVWISGHLARRGIERFVVPATGLPLETIGSSIASLSGGRNANGSNDHAAIDAFVRWW